MLRFGSHDRAPHCRVGKHGVAIEPDKTKIMPTLILNGDYRVKVAGSLVEVLTGQIHINIWAACWLLVGYLKKRSEVELAHRLQIAWGKFHTHKEILTNIHVSLKLRLKYFDAIISPAALFGLASLPLVASQIQRLNVVQRRMLRAVVGWVAVDGKVWQGTMRRMNCKVNSALEVFPFCTWSDSFFKRKFRFAALAELAQICSFMGSQ